MKKCAVIPLSFKQEIFAGCFFSYFGVSGINFLFYFLRDLIFAIPVKRSVSESLLIKLFVGEIKAARTE